MITKEVNETARRLHLEYGSCPQCVLTALQENGVAISDELIQTSHIFSGGTSGVGQGFCGALNGALMAISSFHGRKRSEFGKTTNNKNNEFGKDLINKFIEKYSGISCQDVQNFLVGAAFNHFDETTAKTNSHNKEKKEQCRIECAKLTGQIAEWTYEILERK